MRKRNTYIALIKGDLLAIGCWTSELLLAKSLLNWPHHKGCVWAHESRADLCPLRFSAHERSGVGSESG